LPFAVPLLLPAADEYFGIPYPLPKMDLLAIPDFAAGAMENWGAITYSEKREKERCTASAGDINADNV
jgi:aminopeptidase N